MYVASSISKPSMQVLEACKHALFITCIYIRLMLLNAGTHSLKALCCKTPDYVPHTERVLIHSE